MGTSVRLLGKAFSVGGFSTSLNNTLWTSALPGANNDPEQYFVPIHEQLKKLMLVKRQGVKHCRNNAPRNPLFAYAELSFSNTFNTCSFNSLPHPWGSESGVSTWNIQVSHFPGVHKPNLAMLLATSKSCKIVEKFSSEWFSGYLKNILYSYLFFQACCFNTGGRAKWNSGKCHISFLGTRYLVKVFWS